MAETRNLRLKENGSVPVLFFELHDSLASRSDTIEQFVMHLMWFIRRFTRNVMGMAEAGRYRDGPA